MGSLHPMISKICPDIVPSSGNSWIPDSFCCCYCFVLFCFVFFILSWGQKQENGGLVNGSHFNFYFVVHLANKWASFLIRKLAIGCLIQLNHKSRIKKTWKGCRSFKLAHRSHSATLSSVKTNLVLVTEANSSHMPLAFNCCPTHEVYYHPNFTD